jgi:hypothetical protein
MVDFLQKLSCIIKCNLLTRFIILKSEKIKEIISQDKLKSLESLIKNDVSVKNEILVFLDEYNRSNPDGEIAELVGPDNLGNYNFIKFKNENKVEELLKYFNDTFKTELKSPSNADPSDYIEPASTTTSENSSFIRGRLSDLLFEKVDIIEKSRTKSQERKTYLERELYRVWNIRK